MTYLLPTIFRTSNVKDIVCYCCKSLINSEWVERLLSLKCFQFLIALCYEIKTDCIYCSLNEHLIDYYQSRQHVPHPSCVFPPVSPFPVLVDALPSLLQALHTQEGALFLRPSFPNRRASYLGVSPWRWICEVVVVTWWEAKRRMTVKRDDQA